MRLPRLEAQDSAREMPYQYVREPLSQFVASPSPEESR